MLTAIVIGVLVAAIAGVLVARVLAVRGGDSSVEACLGLAERYVGERRFMEAMVVCKKGLGAAPRDPRGAVMLARVYLGQRKMREAEELLRGVLARDGANREAAELLEDIRPESGRSGEEPS